MPGAGKKGRREELAESLFLGRERRTILLLNEMISPESLP